MFIIVVTFMTKKGSSLNCASRKKIIVSASDLKVKNAGVNQRAVQYKEAQSTILEELMTSLKRDFEQGTDILPIYNAYRTYTHAPNTTRHAALQLSPKSPQNKITAH